MRVDTRVRIENFITFLFLVLMVSILVSEVLSTPAFALPKPYNDIIQQNKEKEKKKKEEEAKKKKKDEEEKKKKDREKAEKEKDGEKKDKENRDRNQDERDKGNDTRFMNPIFKDRDYNPQIKVFSVDLIGSEGRKNIAFRPGENIGMEISYKVLDYDGFDDVSVTWEVRDDGGRSIYRGNRNFPLNLNKTSWVRVDSVVPSGLLNRSERFTVDVDISVANRSERRQVQGTIGFNQGRLRIYDVFLANDNFNFFDNYFGNSVSELVPGRNYRLVVQYEIDGDSNNDIEFEYKLTTYYGYPIVQDRFRDRAKRGTQYATTDIWLPNYIPDTPGTIELEVRSRYGQHETSSQRYYSVRSDSDSYYYDGMNYGSYGNPAFGPIYVSTSPYALVGSDVVLKGKPVYLLVNYEMPLKLNKWVRLYWTVKDSRNRSVFDGKRWLTPDENGLVSVEVKLPEDSQPGLYSYTLRMGDNPTIQSYNGTFEYSDGNNSSYTNRPPDSLEGLIAFQLDDLITFNLPVSWHGKFNYQDNLPPLTFEPSDGVSGMVMHYHFADSDTDINDAILYYEGIESEATGASESLGCTTISNYEPAEMICNYVGTVSYQGRYLKEIEQEVDISTLYILSRVDQGKELYVVRLLGEKGISESLVRYLNTIAGKIEFTNPK